MKQTEREVNFMLGAAWISVLLLTAILMYFA
jgi:hypothetical protein